MLGLTLPKPLVIFSLTTLAVATATAALTLLPPSPDSSDSSTTSLPPGSATSSCMDTWPGYPVPKPAVLPGPSVSCSSIDAYGAALKVSCDASCDSGGGCTMRTTGHSWDCTDGTTSGSRSEAVWICPRSTWDFCDPRPLSPCEVDDTYCDAASSGGTKLVQPFWPTQILSYFGVPAGAAKDLSVGDKVRIGGETFTVKCIAVGDRDGGEETCGNTKATFDIVVVEERPSKTHKAGTPVSW